ncbi:hypothetical protein LTR50_000356 [Elasticomyces elasticus]|nr:hypothetical protein LTR50_000356 [Elasticomyces elasticus]
MKGNVDGFAQLNNRLDTLEKELNEQRPLHVKNVRALNTVLQRNGFFNKEYLYVPWGYGGTYADLPRSIDEIRVGGWRLPIGTKNCSICVGGYFQIDEERVFIAHIWTTLSDQLNNNKISPQSRRQLKAIVTKNLHKESRRCNWPTDHEMMRSTLFVTCPYATDQDWAQDPFKDHTADTGLAVIEAIWDFLDIPDTPTGCQRQRTIHKHHGFVVETLGSEPVPFADVVMLADGDLSGREAELWRNCGEWRGEGEDGGSCWRFKEVRGPVCWTEERPEAVMQERIQRVLSP